MPGGLCIYQGSELGLEQAAIPYERLVDPYGREFYPAFEGRDGSRTPMPWTDHDEHSGFSTHEPWLPIPEAHRARAVSIQESAAGSYLRRLRQFFGWRRGVLPFHGGSFRLREAPAQIFAFERELNGEGILCVFNLSREQRRIELPEAIGARPAEGSGFGGAQDGDHLNLPPWGAYFGWRP
jgi:alpha-glucosidase